MTEKIYGLDLTQKITAVMVRDAIIECFSQAHAEVLDMMDEYTEWKSEEERSRFRNLEIELIIKNLFKEANADFDNPTKESLYIVIDKLAGFAVQFRKPDIVGRHYAEIKEILERCE
jgi:hypothetical protein